MTEAGSQGCVKAASPSACDDPPPVAIPWANATLIAGIDVGACEVSLKRTWSPPPVQTLFPPATMRVLKVGLWESTFFNDVKGKTVV